MRSFIVVLLLISFLIPLNAQTARENLDVIHRGYGTNVSVGEGKIVLSGPFNGIGKYSGGVAIVDTDSGRLQQGWPKVNSEVYCAVSDTKGGWYVGGIFTNVGGVKRTKVAYFNPDKTLNTTFTYEASGEVRALALSGDTLFIGGYFNERLIAVNVKTNKRVPGWIPYFGGEYKYVQNLLLYDSLLCVTGEISEVNGSARNHFALLNARTGALLPVTQNDISFPFRVRFKDSLMFTNVYAMDSLGAEHRFMIARNIITGAQQWKVPYSGNIYGYSLMDSAFYVTGENLRFNDTLRNILSLDPLTGRVLPWNVPQARSCTRTVVTTAALYCSYYDSTFAYDRKSGALLPWDPMPDKIVHTVAFDGKNLLLGGEFTSLNPQLRNGLALLDETSGALLPYSHTVASAHPMIGRDLITSSQIIDSILYLTGTFDSVDGRSRKRFAAISLRTDSLLPLAIDFSDSTDLTSTVSAAVIRDSVIYIGGKFREIEHAAGTANLAAVSRTTGELLDWNVRPNNDVSDLQWYNGALYVSGGFDSIQNSAVKGLVCFKDGMLTSWRPHINQYYGPTMVRRFTILNGKIYVGGDFDTVDSLPRLHLAAFDLSTGNVTAWNPKTNDNIYDMKSAANVIYVVGPYNLGGAYRNGLFALNASDGSVINWEPYPTLGVSQCHVTKDFLYVTGSFNQLGGLPNSYRRTNGFGAVSLPAATLFAGNEPASPLSFILEQNYPNPFNPSTTIRFALPVRSRVKLEVFDLLGRSVATLVEGGLEAGEHQVRFNGANNASGVYYYRLTAGESVRTRSMVLVK